MHLCHRHTGEDKQMMTANTETELTALETGDSLTVNYDSVHSEAGGEEQSADLTVVAVQVEERGLTEVTVYLTTGDAQTIADADRRIVEKTPHDDSLMAHTRFENRNGGRWNRIGRLNSISKSGDDGEDTEPAADGGEPVVMTDGGEDVHVRELHPDNVSDAGLDIMDSHLLEAVDRIERAADRSDGVDLDEFGPDQTHPSFRMSDAVAQLYEVMFIIQRERDIREEQASEDADPGDEGGEVMTDGGRVMTDGGEDMDVFHVPLTRVAGLDVLAPDVDTAVELAIEHSVCSDFDVPVCQGTVRTTTARYGPEITPDGRTDEDDGPLSPLPSVPSAATLGKRLVEEREALGLKQRDIVQNSDLSAGVTSRMENGTLISISKYNEYRDTLAKLSER